MSEELVSALLDGECDGRDIDRLLTAFERDEALRSRFSRLQFAREVRRGVSASGFDEGFAVRVMSAIGDEMPETSSPKRVPLRRRRPVWVPVGGYAAAASVVVAVAAGLLFSDTRTDESPVTAASTFAAAPTNTASERAASLPIVPVATTGVRTSPAVSPVPAPVLVNRAAQLRWAQIEAEQARQLNNYLIDYSNYRSAQGVGGTLGYARFAAHTADYRTQGE